MIHPPSMILAKLFIERGLFGNPPDGDWPLFISFLPDGPDNAAALFDTTGIYYGRVFADLANVMVRERHGIELLARGNHYDETFLKIRNVVEWFDNNVSRLSPKSVTIEGTTYNVISFVRSGNVHAIGFDKQERALLSVNGTVQIETP